MSRCYEPMLWSVDHIATSPTPDGKDSVIDIVYWSVTGDNGSSIDGMVVLGAPDYANFIPIEEITEEQILEMVYPNLLFPKEFYEDKVS